MHEIVNASRSHLPFGSSGSSVSCSRHVVLQFAKSLHCKLAELRRVSADFRVVRFCDQVSPRAAKKVFLQHLSIRVVYVARCHVSVQFLVQTPPETVKPFLGTELTNYNQLTLVCKAPSRVYHV